MNPKEIVIKSWPAPFEAVLNGTKRHEVRLNDRDYQEGDQVLLYCWNPATKEYDGRIIAATVGNVTRGGFGLPADMCCFTLLKARVGGELLIDAGA